MPTHNELREQLLDWFSREDIPSRMEEWRNGWAWLAGSIVPVIAIPLPGTDSIFAIYGDTDQYGINLLIYRAYEGDEVFFTAEEAYQYALGQLAREIEKLSVDFRNLTEQYAAYQETH